MFAYPIVDENHPQATPEERAEYEQHKARIYALIDSGAPERERDQAILALVRWLKGHRHWNMPRPARRSPRQQLAMAW